MGHIFIQTTAVDQNVPGFFAWITKKNIEPNNGEIKPEIEPNDDVDAPIHHISCVRWNKNFFVLKKNRKFDDEHCDGIYDRCDLAVLYIHVNHVVSKAIGATNVKKGNKALELYIPLM